MLDVKLYRIRQSLLQVFLEEKALDGILLNRADNFSMATGGGRNLVWTYGDLGSNGLLVMRNGETFYVGNGIERDRCMEEELKGLDCGELVGGWWDTTPASLVTASLKGRFASDDGSLGANLHGELAQLRALLSPLEQEKYRKLGKLAAEAMMATLKQIKKGTSEAEVAAILKYEGAKRECQVPVALVAADERARRYRHPIASETSLLGGDGGLKVEQYVMVVGCFLREGLVVSLTRFAQVEEVGAELVEAYRRICRVDAKVQLATRPGRNLGEVFSDLLIAYQEEGFSSDEWHRHHQGGAAGYAGRTCKAVPGESFPALPLHWARKAEEKLEERLEWATAYAWNPSASGVKSEETFLLHESGAKEIVSRTAEIGDVQMGDDLGGIARSGMFDARAN